METTTTPTTPTQQRKATHSDCDPVLHKKHCEDAPGAHIPTSNGDAAAAGTNSGDWYPFSWRGRPIKHQPKYEDQAELNNALRKVHALPPIVHEQEMASLKAYLAKACNGEMFVLQGGDCAERFQDCTQEAIEKKFKILLQMSLIIIAGSRLPVVRLARMAGQFAKPRSSDIETVEGVKVHSYLGDSVNCYDPSDRRPDPRRLVDAYFHSAATVNYLRAMIAGGVSDLASASQWKLDNVLSPKVREEYESLVTKILDAMSFLTTIQAFSEATRSVNLFTSHEGLILDYEAALTIPMRNGDYYNSGAHFLWIGDRTRSIDGAHIEYFRGIKNPIGVKVGPSMTSEDLVRLIQILNPDREPGRLTLITRYGAKNIERCLPGHIEVAQSTGIPVLWISDPCHGNTEVTATGIKTRNIENVMSELEQAFKIHARCGSHLGGVHLELTCDDVTECVGGKVQYDNLSTKYESFCDPRLNYTQSLDMAFSIVRSLNECKTHKSDVSSPRIF
jgi:3-deoxy-7-phosphoheptulonate synthase